ncbi:MAG: hypothetical protein K2Y71_07550 [Xanthobacteraceae bacterium]|nr:hypothetical protein [Xanthobacteraceae bacterium]
MKALISMMALAVALAWPGAGEAQSQKSTARSKATAKHHVQRPAKAKRGDQYVRSAGGQRCAREMWYGCVGWDPDGAVRDMLARDVGDDN